MTSAPAQPIEVPAQMLPPEALPDVDNLVTEDDTPVDNIFSEKQMRLLTEPLYSSWAGAEPGQKFLAMANVGLFFAVREPPLVPDMLLSLDVEAPEDLWAKGHRSYFMWLYGKPPDVVIEIVSNQEGGEADTQLRLYARIAVAYYVIFDPLKQIQSESLRVYQRRAGRYVDMTEHWLSGVQLGLTLWEGEYEGTSGVWLRWCDQQGNVILTGAERARQAQQRVDQLEAQLRALGIEPSEERPED